MCETLRTPFTASIGIKRVSSSQVLLIKCCRLTDHQQVMTMIMTNSIKAEVLAVCWSGAFRCVITQCRGGKMSAMILEKQLFLPINLGRVTSPFPNKLNILHHSTVRKIIYKWKTFKKVVSLARSGRPSKFTQR